MAEALLNPNGQPVLQLSFLNGWTASVAVLRPGPCGNSLAAWPTLRQQGNVEIGQQEADDEEVAAWLHQVAQRPRFTSGDVR